MNLDYNLIKILSNPNTFLPSFCKILQEDLLGSLSDSVSFLQAPSRTYKNLLVSWQFLLKSYNIIFYLPLFLFLFLKNEQIQAVLKECRVQQTCTLALIWEALSMMEPEISQTIPEKKKKRTQLSVRNLLNSAVQNRRSLFSEKRPFYYEVDNQKKRSIHACFFCGTITISDERDSCISRCMALMK